MQQLERDCARSRPVGMPARGDLIAMPFGLPPCVVMAGGAMMSAFLVSLLVYFSPAAQETLHNWHQSRLPPCTEAAVAAAPALKASLAALTSSLDSRAAISASNATAMLRVTRQALALVECKGGMAHLGVDAISIRRTQHRLMNALRRKHTHSSLHHHST